MFFIEAAGKLKLSGHSTVLDLCCGRGELASRFSDYCKEVIAVDGSPGMLSRKIVKDNVSYHLLDVNQGDPGAIGVVDHIVIGSAIHWVSGAALETLMQKHLRQGGRIFVTHTLFRFDGQPYGSTLVDLNSRFGRDPGERVDLWGKAKLSHCGYREADLIRQVRNVSLDLRYLLRNQLSYAYGEFFDLIMADVGRYEKEFTDALSPFVVDGRLPARLVNWGVIYAPAG